MSLICRPRLTSCQASASWSVESPEGNMLTANALRMCLKRKAGRTLLQIYLCVSYAVQRLFFFNDLLKQSLVVEKIIVIIYQKETIILTIFTIEIVSKMYWLWCFYFLLTNWRFCQQFLNDYCLQFTWLRWHLARRWEWRIPWWCLLGQLQPRK